MDGKRANRDRVLSEIARRQHGIVSIGQLRAIGISEDAAAGRARAGRLHRIHRGVYAVGHRAQSRKARWMAVVLACGTGGGTPDRAGQGGRSEAEGFSGPTMPVLEYWGAALSHRSAAELWELLPARDGPVDVSVAGDGGRARRTGIRLHRSLTLLPASVTLRSGIPVTAPARTIADLRRVSVGKRRLVTPRKLRRAIRQANVLGLPIEGEDRRSGSAAIWRKTSSRSVAGIGCRLPRSTFASPSISSISSGENDGSSSKPMATSTIGAALRSRTTAARIWRFVSWDTTSFVSRIAKSTKNQTGSRRC